MPLLGFPAFSVRYTFPIPHNCYLLFVTPFTFPAIRYVVVTLPRSERWSPPLRPLRTLLPAVGRYVTQRVYGSYGLRYIYGCLPLPTRWHFVVCWTVVRCPLRYPAFDVIVPTHLLFLCPVEWCLRYPI